MSAPTYFQYTEREERQAAEERHLARLEALYRAPRGSLNQAEFFRERHWDLPDLAGVDLAAERVVVLCRFATGSGVWDPRREWLQTRVAAIDAELEHRRRPAPRTAVHPPPPPAPAPTRRRPGTLVFAGREER